MRFPGFIGPSYTLQSPNVDCQRSVNLFPEMNELGTGKEKEAAFLAPSPGLRLVVTLPQSPVRGMWRASNGQVFAVGGDRMYRVTYDGMTFMSSELGVLNTSTGPVSIADNGIQVVVVDGPGGYVWTLDPGTFNVITDPDFPGADQVTYQDGYFLFNHPDTGQFFFSGINAVSFDALDFATAEASPDELLGILSSNQNVYMLGSQTIEVFYNSGDNDNPWQRVAGAVIETGVSSAFTAQKLPGGGFAWLGGDATGQGIVYRLEGTQAKRISTPAVETIIRKRTAAEIASAKAWVYQQGGHIFYALNISGMAFTLVYDMSTNMWHDRTYLDVKKAQRHRADCHAVGFGFNLVGDYQNGQIYVLDPDKYTDYGTSIQRIRAAPHITKELKRVFHTYFQLDMEVGVGLDGTGQGTDPHAVLQWSDDGGHSWSNERWATIGKIGQTRWRVIWRRLGASRDRVYRVTVTDPVKIVLIGADLGLEEGAS